MQKVYVVYYNYEHPDDYDDKDYGIVGRIFATEEAAIRYCESVGTKCEVAELY